jgi:hypothetical protein
MAADPLVTKWAAGFPDDKDLNVDGTPLEGTSGANGGLLRLPQYEYYDNLRAKSATSKSTTPLPGYGVICE